MSSKVSALMGQRERREVTTMGTGDIDILVGIGVMSEAEAGQEITDEGDYIGRIHGRISNSIRLSYELYDLTRSNGAPP